MADVVLANLTKSFPARKGSEPVYAVNDVSLSIADREFMVLVGPSGCGKSTTLRLIAGLEEETSGSISIGGRRVNGVPPKDRDIAMVFQNYALYPHMSVAENLGFGLKLRKVPPAEISERIHRASELLALTGLLERRPKELSGGQRQRVAVGRAIVRDPKVFLFDEPLSNLDAQMRVSMRTEISRLHTRLGATMIYVTHDQVEAMTMGDRICVMNAGRIMQVADPLTLYNHPAHRFVAGFIGTPAMNFFPGHIDGGRFRETNDKGAPLILPFPGAEKHTGRAVALGIRPENICRAGDLHQPHPRGNPDRSVQDTDPTYAATVELAETHGAETFLHLTTGATTFIARVPPELRPTPGEKVSVTLDPAKAHLFDTATGERL